MKTNIGTGATVKDENPRPGTQIDLDWG
jgi:hypothetical protein